MLTFAVPPGTPRAVLAFLQSWSGCMMAMMMMTEEDKHIVERIFKEVVEPEADCPEMKALDSAFITYLLHKCGSPEAVGSMAPKARP
jgi:hypothetical protein